MKLVPNSEQPLRVLKGHHRATIESPYAVRLQAIPEKNRSQPEPGLEDLLTIWSLARQKPHPNVEYPATMWSPLARTVWPSQVFGTILRFYWPGLMPLRKIGRLSMPSSKPPILRGWLLLNLNLGDVGQRKELQEKKTISAVLDYVNDILNNPLRESFGINSSDISKWFTSYLPVLAAPEFGLPRDEADELLSYFLNKGYPYHRELWCRTWSHAREEALHYSIHQNSHQASATDAYKGGNAYHISYLKERVRAALGESRWDTIERGREEVDEDEKRAEEIEKIALEWEKQRPTAQDTEK